MCVSIKNGMKQQVPPFYRCVSKSDCSKASYQGIENVLGFFKIN